MKPDELEEYFVGEKTWANFVEVFNVEWGKCPFKEQLIKTLGGHEDIAKVVYATVEDQALKWVNEPAPALGNISPKECLQSDRTVKRLKEMLMRMPR